MSWSKISRDNFATFGISSLALTLAVACGTARESEIPSEGSTTAAQQPANQQSATQPTVAQSASGGAVPTTLLQPTPAGDGTMAAAPMGTLNTGLKETEGFLLHPRTLGNPQIYVMSTAPITESLFTVNSDLGVVPMLAREWEVSEDSLTWTFYLVEGVQFHKGYGEMVADDVIWSMQQFADSAKHPRASNIRGVFMAEDGHAKAIDDYTIEVNTGTPWSEVPINEMLTSPAGSATWIVSKRQTEELGAEAASSDIAATGSWELVEARTGEFWRMAAVEDHWRKTPHFAELIFREIPEESSRVAGFQTENLDTTLIAFDSLALIEEVPGAELMRLSGGGEAAVTFYGQYYVGIGTEDQQPGYDPDLPWVSANPDLDSEEWKNAVKVRTALSIAIDRQGIVDTLLHGYGSPAVLWDFGRYEDSWLPPELRWEFNPEKATLAEAGYPDGFTITLTPSLRGAPVEVEACEAIATMWADIGVDVKFQQLPYSALRPSLIARTYQGSTCHAGSIRLEPGQGGGGVNPANIVHAHFPWRDQYADRPGDAGGRHSHPSGVYPQLPGSGRASADPGMGIDGVRRPRPLGGGVVDIHYAGARHNVHGVVDEPVWRLASGPFGSPATTAGIIVSNQGSERLTSSHV